MKHKSGEKISSFVLRVYGIFINEANQILLSDEYFLDTPMIKLPGGGLEPGEGIKNCLRREIREEMGAEIVNIRHFYTTDFFQKALFYTDRQLISFYYQADFIDEPALNVTHIPADFSAMKNGDQSMRWVPLSAFDPDELTFPIDKEVGKLILKEYNIAH
ncbi:MAG: NUDIX domain-containing protein [Bacteroidota bacterium]